MGSYNLDPPAESLNTEVGLLTEDETIARELRAEIGVDLRPENAWVNARRRYPIVLRAVQLLIDGNVSITPSTVDQRSAKRGRPNGVMSGIRTNESGSLRSGLLNSVRAVICHEANVS